jgi:hypothetical protein
MMKCREIVDPNSCFNKAKQNELIFVFLERDAAAPAAIRAWIAERIKLGLNIPGDKKLVDAEWCAREMELQRTERNV